MSRPSRHILRIGVTGGIGSGKTAACRIFRQHGIPVVSADNVAKTITDSHPAVKKRLIAILGPEAFGTRGRLNRPYVASKLFGNKRIQRAINAAVHPRVLAEIRRQIVLHRKKGHRAIVVEAALIFEAGVQNLLDLVIVIEADRNTVVRRIRKRDKLPLAAIRRRIASQWSSTRKRKKADIVIRNNGSLSDLRMKIRFLLHLFGLYSKGRTHA